MSAGVIQKLLIVCAIIVLIGQAVVVVLPFFTEDSVVSASEIGGREALFIRSFSLFLSSLPLPALSVWAAYNAKPFKRFTNKALRRVLWFVVVCVLLATIVQIKQSFDAAAPYLSQLQNWSLSWVAETFNWHFYSFAEIALLLFCIWQLKSKEAAMPAQKHTESPLS